MHKHRKTTVTEGLQSEIFVPITPEPVCFLQLLGFFFSYGKKLHRTHIDQIPDVPVFENMFHSCHPPTCPGSDTKQTSQESALAMFVLTYMWYSPKLCRLNLLHEKY
jgi:hypothetical protein